MLWYGGKNSCPEGQRRGLWSHTVWGSLACCFDLEAEGLQPVYNLLRMNIHLQECCEEFRLTFDRKLLKVTSFQRKGRKNIKHSLTWSRMSPYLELPLLGQWAVPDLQVLQHLLEFLYSLLSLPHWPFQPPFLVFSSQPLVWSLFWLAGCCQEREAVSEQRKLWRNQVGKWSASVCQAKKAKTLTHACVIKEWQCWFPPIYHFYNHSS